MSIVHIADGWLLWVSLSVDGVLFKLVMRAVAVGRQLWVAWMVGVVLFRMELMVVSLMVSVRLFTLLSCSVAVGWPL